MTIFQLILAWLWPVHGMVMGIVGVIALALGLI